MKPFPKPEVIFLDVYHTLLDLTPMERRINALLDSRRGYTVWNSLFLQYCFMENCNRPFHPFTDIARATLSMSATYFQRKISDDEIDATLDLLKHLPLHEGVPEGLSRLADGGFRLAALTNAPRTVVADRMERTGLVSYFEALISAEKAGKYKPCGEVYEMALREMGVAPAAALMVSAHDWDLAGAAAAGMHTACLRGERQVTYPLAPAPTLSCPSLSALAAMLE